MYSFRKLSVLCKTCSVAGRQQLIREREFNSRRYVSPFHVDGIDNTWGNKLKIKLDNLRWKLSERKNNAAKQNKNFTTSNLFIIYKAPVFLIKIM